MEIIEYLKSVDCALQPYQEAVIRELQTRHRIEVVVTPHRVAPAGRTVQDWIHLQSAIDNVYMRQMSAFQDTLTSRARHWAIMPLRSPSFKSPLSGPPWVTDKYSLPQPSTLLPSRKTRALLARIGV